MNTENPCSSPERPQGRIASIHLHPVVGGEPMLSVNSAELVAAKGIQGDQRYFERISRKTGQLSTSHVSLIEREQIRAHSQALKVEPIAPGTVRSNIETEGVDLAAYMGCEIQIGTAMLLVHSFREPCAKMDQIASGLRELMKNGRQGVLARVVRSGTIGVGDTVCAMCSSAPV